MHMALIGHVPVCVAHLDVLDVCYTTIIRYTWQLVGRLELRDEDSEV